MNAPKPSCYLCEEPSADWDAHDACIALAREQAAQWAWDAEVQIEIWSKDASAAVDTNLVKVVAEQANLWTDHIVRDGVDTAPCPEEQCMSYWRDFVDVEEMRVFIGPEIDVASLVTTGWLEAEPDADIYRLSRPLLPAHLGR